MRDLIDVAQSMTCAPLRTEIEQAFPATWVRPRAGAGQATSAAAVLTPGLGGTICQESFATGLCNPFRIAFDPNDGSAQQRFFINDVGQSTWEEIDVGRARADYGWPIWEGPCPIGTSTGCTPQSRFVDPIFAYDRTDGCTVITGGAFVPQSAHWPTAYANAYLFADLGCGSIFALRNESPGQTPEVLSTRTGAIDLQFGPDGALYYTTYEGGQVRRIVAPS
jgi:glucose/arabinose dehydrogenase